MSWIIIVIIVVIAILLWYVITSKLEKDKEIKKEKTFNEVPPDYVNKDVKELTEELHKDSDTDPMTHYRLGVLYYNNYQDLSKSYKHFRKALECLHQTRLNSKLSLQDRRFMTERIASYMKLIEKKTAKPGNTSAAAWKPVETKIKQTLVDLANIQVQVDRMERHPLLMDDDNEMQRALLQIATMEKNIKKESKQKELQTETKVAQQIEAKVKFHTDAQNVHDETLIKCVNSQFNKIKGYNSKDPATYATDLGSFEKYLTEKGTDKAKDVYRFITQVNSPWDGNLKETEILTEVWKRINSTPNQNNRQLLAESLIEKLENIEQAHGKVCISGRVPNYISSLHTLDADPELGMLKNKEAYRNEFLVKVAHATDLELKKLPEDQMKTYNDGGSSTEIKGSVDAIKGKIDEFAAEYKPFLPAAEIETLAEQCKETL